ncbi:MAG TPA: hypothetical protein VFO12_09665 [Sphingomicrobium sp.]|mgnify:CR=1 FL=1|nr:hypothetical protein [Sphingomicrobium sp.]
MRSLSCILACAVLATGAPASAEPETGSRLDRRPNAVVDSANDPIVSRVINTFARCVAGARPEWSDGLLAMQLLSDEQMRVIGKEATGLNQCYQTSQFDLHFNPLSFVGGVAEQRVAARFKGAEVTKLSTITDDMLFASAAAPKTTAEDLASCIARRDPTIVRALIDTKPTSTEEATLIGKLVKHLGGCVPAGAKLKLNKQTVRAYAAVGLHHLLANEAALASAKSGQN